MRDLLLLTLAATLLGAVEGGAQQASPPDSLEARVWLDRGEEPVLQRGDEVRVYYRTSADAYVAIFRIDTDGTISMLFPQHPDADVFVRGGRDYRLLFPRSPRWRVEEDPGVGYFFMVASPEPLDFSLFEYDDRRGWGLGAIGAEVYEDPYVAIDDYVATIVPDWEVVPYALDFLTYNVGTPHSYPRFLCYDCHGFRSYAAWNPYMAPCPSYRVVIWDDPYFYPRYRYVGTRVVFARPLAPRPRYEVVVRARGSAWTPLVRRREAPPRRVVEYKESPGAAPAYQPRNPRPSRPAGAVTPSTGRRAVPFAAPNRAGAPGEAGSTRVASPGRSSGATLRQERPARPPSSATGTGGREAGRPTLQRRPSSPSERLREGGAVPGTTARGTTGRGTTSRGTTTLGSGRARGGQEAAPPARRPPQTRIVRPPGSQRPSATPARPPSRGAPGARPATRPGGGFGAVGRPPASGGSRVVRPPTRGGGRAAPPPRRRPGGRGGGEGG